MSQTLPKSAVYVWDLTISAEKTDEHSLKKKFKSIAKKWIFQKEEGEHSGFIHYQCRLSLHKKVVNPFKLCDGHWSPTSSNSAEDFYEGYCNKYQTRVEGPWRDTDEEVYIPKQFRNLILRPWQHAVLQRSQVFNDRLVNVVYDPDGNSGKSTLASISELKYGGIDLPPCNDQKELMQVMCDICVAKNTRSPNPVFVDLPRALDKSRLYGIYSAIEQIKKGKLYDLRYKYKEWWIDSPAIWVFTNTRPDTRLLSKDRWLVWNIKNGFLTEYENDSDSEEEDPNPIGVIVDLSSQLGLNS